MATGRIKHFLGSFATDAAANNFVAVQGWCVGDMVGMIAYDLTPGLTYYNTSTGTMRFWDGTIWEDFGAFWDIFTVINGDLVAQVAAAGANERTFLIYQPEPLGQNLTIPANITLYFVREGRITVTAPFVLTHQGDIEADARQIFACANGGVLLAGATTSTKAAKVVRVEWFGAAVDNATDDVNAWTAAITAITGNSPAGGTVQMGAGVSRFSGTLAIPSRVQLAGVGVESSTMRYTGAATAITNADALCRYSGAHDFTLDCLTNNPAVRGFGFTGLGLQSRFSRLKVLGAGGGYGIHLFGPCWSSTWECIHVGGFEYGVRMERDDIGATGQPNANSFDRLDVATTSVTCVYLWKCGYNWFKNVDLEFNAFTGYGIYLGGDATRTCSSNVFTEIRMSDNNGATGPYLIYMTYAHRNRFNNVICGLDVSLVRLENDSTDNQFIGVYFARNVDNQISADATSRRNFAIGDTTRADDKFGLASPGNAFLPNSALNTAAYCIPVEAFGAAGDGVTDDRAAFLRAIDVIGTDIGGGAIELAPNCTYRLSEWVNFPRNITVSARGGSRIKPDNGKLVSFLGPVDCGRAMLCDVSAGGTFRFLYSPTIRPEWFGAAIDGVTDDYAAWTAALAALNLGGRGGTIFFDGGTSVIATGISVPTMITIAGSHRDQSVIQYTGAASAVTFNGAPGTDGGLSNLTIKCTQNVAGVRALHLIELGDRMNFEKITLLGAGDGRGLYAVGTSHDWVVRGLRTSVFAYGIYLDRDGTGAPEDVHFYDVRAYSISTCAIHLYRATANMFYGVRIGNCTCTEAAVHIIGDEDAGAALQGAKNQFHGLRISPNGAMTATYAVLLEQCVGNYIYGLFLDSSNDRVVRFGTNANMNEIFGLLTPMNQLGNISHDATSHDNVVHGSNRDYTFDMGHLAGSAVIEPRIMAELDVPRTATADDQHPTVRGCRVLYLPSGTGAWAIANLHDGRIGQIVSLVVQAVVNIPTIADGGNFKLSAAWAPATDGTLTLYNDGTSWIELARSAN